MRNPSRVCTAVAFLVGILVVALNVYVSFIRGSECGGVNNTASHTKTDLTPKWRLDPETGESYGMVVVACTSAVRKEKGVGLDWLADVPATWMVFVYEKCAPTKVHENSTWSLRPNIKFRTVENIGEDEGTSYMHYITENYDNLPDVSIFMQDDGLLTSARDGRSMDDFSRSPPHTPFSNFSQLEMNTKRFLMKDRGFLHYGVVTYGETFGYEDYHGRVMQALWPLLATPEMPSPGKSFTFQPGSSFAVRKERILQRSVDVYVTIRKHFYYGWHLRANTDAIKNDEPKSKHALLESNFIGDPRQHACAMERMYHILFGDPPILPESAKVVSQMRSISAL